MIWKKKSKFESLIQFIKDFNLFAKQFYDVVWNVEKKTDSKNPKVAKKGRLIILWKGVICNSKKSRFIKEQEAIGLFSSLGRKAPLRQIPLLGLLLF